MSIWNDNSEGESNFYNYVMLVANTEIGKNRTFCSKGTKIFFISQDIAREVDV